eukprot:6490025-Amphidinium_carterae.1
MYSSTVERLKNPRLQRKSKVDHQATMRKRCLVIYLLWASFVPIGALFVESVADRWLLTSFS